LSGFIPRSAMHSNANRG